MEDRDLDVPSLQFLGQAGVFIRSKRTKVLIDPYLSNAVGRKYGSSLNRRFPPPISTSSLREINWTLLTHAHLDHTDPETLVPLAATSPSMKFFAPYESRQILTEIGLGNRIDDRLGEVWVDLAEDIAIRPVPAAHLELERNAEGELRYLGYLVKVNGTCIYHAGDTIPHREVNDALCGERIDIAMLPINERNFYRARADIIGNMTLREGFQFAADIGARTLVPLHWDMFGPNMVHPEEIELLYQLEHPPFELKLLKSGQSLKLVTNL